MWSSGPCVNVLPTRSQLLLFPAELMVRRATERIRAVPRSDDPQQLALDVLTELLPLAPDRRVEPEVDIALIAEAPALPEPAAIRDEAARRLEEACTQLVELLVSRPRDEDVVRQGRRLHTLVDGLAVHLLTASPDGSGWAVDILRDELARVRATAAGG